ncbi:hypothetical protein BN77_p2140061 [Rhizobium mesoamericanum STM3625]|uniref:Uncharacterized protein n=1 Tax=Rhizobium mesoamericanum STM3625 TaxID=1211777 RepID=K0Q6J4_9HYPH|nr:hypothetical protein BN77_p2140061 [Rhizobium mesoamericanum STM3625]
MRRTSKMPATALATDTGLPELAVFERLAGRALLRPVAGTAHGTWPPGLLSPGSVSWSGVPLLGDQCA